MHPGTCAAPQLRSAAGRPDVRLARRREFDHRRLWLPPRGITRHEGDGSVVIPNASPSAVDLGPDTGRMRSPHTVESGVPLTVFTEPSASSPKP